jgi:hypothetical protein
MTGSTTEGGRVNRPELRSGADRLRHSGGNGADPAV